jgi:hypothetical protein
VTPGAFLSSLYQRKVVPFLNPGPRRLEALRRDWGKPVARERDLFLIGLLHHLGPEAGTPVDEVTWQDLAMDDVFARIDRTCSMPGRQMLYHHLRTLETDGGILAERSRQQAVIRADAGFREAAQLSLARLEGPDAAWLAPLILEQLPRRPAFALLLHLSSLLSLLCLAGLYLSTWFLFPALALIITNIAVNETYGRRITRYLPGFTQLERLFGVCAELAALPDPHHFPQLQRIREAAPLAALLRRKLQFLALDRTRVGDIGKSFLGYLNMLFLLDILVFVRSLDALTRAQPELLALLEAAASLDATIAVASYLEGLPYATVPTLVTDRQLQVRDLYHPLLADPVGNPLTLDGRSALITGSNMAGKTTFIRTVGINVILAQTLHLCLAREALLPRAVVCASIRRADRLEDGQSTYFAELERLLGFIQAGDQKRLHLFLIDEIFRGTNTVERLAASTAVLHHLGRGHLFLVTSHDLELEALLADTCDLLHFSEEIRDGAYGFSYRIQAGPARSRNAIRLLELSGYPAEVVQEARLLADRIAACT